MLDSEICQIIIAILLKRKIEIFFAQSVAIDVVAALAAQGFPVKLTATPLPEVSGLGCPKQP